MSSISSILTGKLLSLYTLNVLVILPTLVKTVSKRILSFEKDRSPPDPSLKKSFLQEKSTNEITIKKNIFFTIDVAVCRITNLMFAIV